MRGEHRLSRLTSTLKHGLSPHARGTYDLFPQIHACSRFIPACAGNISTASQQQGCNSVYPRMRGEHDPRRIVIQPVRGLSPHARGTYCCASALVVMVRFIPACAGNIRSVPTDSCLFPVYPRMRGEHSSASCFDISPNGLSPHARGTFYGQSTITPSKRFIPACAGNIARSTL